jgi:HEAT repeat protein
MEDPNVWVRLEAAKALANIPDDRAVPVLIKHLGDTSENKDVRIASADALRSFKSSEAAQALVGALQDHDFGVAYQAHSSLRFITGKDYKYDAAAWLTYIAGPGKPVG